MLSRIKKIVHMVRGLFSSFTLKHLERKIQIILFILIRIWNISQYHNIILQFTYELSITVSDIFTQAQSAAAFFHSDKCRELYIL